LNLIEDTEVPGGMGMRRRRKPSFSAFCLGSLSAAIARMKLALKDWLIQLKGGIDEPNLKLWNKALAFLAVVLFIYLSADFMLHRLDLKQFTKMLSGQKTRSFQQNVTAEVRPFSYYLEMVQRRDIFSAVKLRSASDPEDETKKALAEMLKDLKLVGISWGSDPEVILEDSKANKTYFLKAGETVGTFKVDSIMKDKVVLESGGQKMELK